jgi:hypothetical protein
MEENKQKNTSTGAFVQTDSVDYTIRGDGMGIPVYEKYKGKTATGSKEWETTKGEKIALTILMCVMIPIVIGAFVVYFSALAVGIKVLILVLTIVFMLCSIGGFILVVTLRHNKKDPIEMHYYDVDYEKNHITGEGYDHTKEISKEEFKN